MSPIAWVHRGSELFSQTPLGGTALSRLCYSARGHRGEAHTASDYLPCLVSGTGGFNDKSFNESAFDGMTEAAAELGVDPITVESAEEGDYAPNIDQLVSQGCDLIVSVGFPLADATKAAASNPDIEFAREIRELLDPVTHLGLSAKLARDTSLRVRTALAVATTDG